MARTLSNQIEQLEEELDDAVRRYRHAEERVMELTDEIEQAEAVADELQERLNSFVAYIEQIAPGAHNAWLIANKLEA